MRNLRLLFLVGLATVFFSEQLFVSSQTTFSTADDLYLEGRTSGDIPLDDEGGDDEDDSGSGSGDNAFNFTDAEEMLRRFLNFSQTTLSKEVVPTHPEPSSASPHSPSTTAADSRHPTTRVKDNTETTPLILTHGDNSDEVAGPTAVLSTQSTITSTTSTSMPETTASKVGMDSTVGEPDADEDNSLDRWDVSTTKSSEDEVLIEDVDNEVVFKDGRGSRMYDLDSPEEVTSENMWLRTEVLAAVIACGVVGFLCAVFLLLLLAYRMKKKDEGSYDLGDNKVSSTAYQKAPTKEFYA